MKTIFQNHKEELARTAQEVQVLEVANGKLQQEVQDLQKELRVVQELLKDSQEARRSFLSIIAKASAEETKRIW